MRNIRIKITRDGSNAVRSMPLEEYLRGVVPSEIPASSGEAALQAQAVAARTYAAQKMLTRVGQAFDVDDTTSYQAYKPNNTDPRTDAAILDTAGMILTYGGKILDTCVYSASNGGRTVSAKERWKSERAYLPERDDPYDKRAGYKKNGHGVGLSQRGAQQAAKEGLTCRQILEFYYPGAAIADVEAFFDASEPAQRNLRRGNRGEDVVELQSDLDALYYAPGAADGIFGAKTEAAVKAMQQTTGLAADGVFGPKSRAALLELPRMNAV